MKADIFSPIVTPLAATEKRTGNIVLSAKPDEIPKTLIIDREGPNSLLTSYIVGYLLPCLDFLVRIDDERHCEW